MTWSIAGKTVLVTGANSGIGLAAAKALAGSDADVTITARNPERGASAIAEIEEATGRTVSMALLDLADRTSVEQCAEEVASRHASLDVLINNAGGIFGSRRETVDGWEMTLATNHLGPFLLTHRLTPLLASSPEARIVNVASSGHGYAKHGFDFDDPHFTNGYRMMRAYGQSKLANIHHAAELDRRFAGEGIHAYSMHPGLVSTSIGQGGDAWMADVLWRLTRRRQITPDEGADTIVWLATAPEPDPPGGYFELREEARSSRHARDTEQAVRVWDWSMDTLGLEATT